MRDTAFALFKVGIEVFIILRLSDNIPPSLIFSHAFDSVFAIIFYAIRKLELGSNTYEISSCEKNIYAAAERPFSAWLIIYHIRVS